MLQTEHTCHLAIVLISCHDIFIVTRSSYHSVQLNMQFEFVVETYYFIFILTSLLIFSDRPCIWEEDPSEIRDMGQRRI